MTDIRIFFGGEQSLYKKLMNIADKQYRKDLQNLHKKSIEGLELKKEKLKDKLEDDLLTCEHEINILKSKMKRLKLKCKEEINDIDMEIKLNETILKVSSQTIDISKLKDEDNLLT